MTDGDRTALAPVPPGPPAPSSPPTPDAPSWNDPTIARASEVIGGPIGRYAHASRRWSAVAVLLVVTAGTLMLAFVQKSPCANAQWAHNDQYTRVCYSDVIPLWSTEQLDVGAVPYRDHPVEYPVLTGGFMWVSAEVTRGVGSVIGTSPGGLVVVFGMVTVCGLAMCGLLVTYFTAGANRGRPWDAAVFAASPLLIFHAYSNWDLLAMAFTSAALWAWARDRPVLAGALIGLGTAAKLYPALLLVALVILAVRTGRYRAVQQCVVAAAVGWIVVNAPVAWLWFDGWKTFYVFSAQRDAEASTVWAWWQYFHTGGYHGGSPGGFEPSGVLVALLLTVALISVAGLGLAAPVRPRLAQLALLVVAAFLLTTKVWSPQYSLWLVPLVALARPRFRISLLWQASEILVWVITLLWLAGFDDPKRVIDYGWLMLVIWIRDAFLITILALVVREMWHPELDVVRADGSDDPGGGPFDRAPDLGFSLTTFRQRALAGADRRGDEESWLT